MSAAVEVITVESTLLLKPAARLVPSILLTAPLSYHCVPLTPPSELKCFVLVAPSVLGLGIEQLLNAHPPTYTHLRTH